MISSRLLDPAVRYVSWLQQRNFFESKVGQQEPSARKELILPKCIRIVTKFESASAVHAMDGLRLVKVTQRIQL